MQKKLIIIMILSGLSLQAQTALYNGGNIRIHPDGQLGFHTSLINNSAFDQNQGLVGFYGNSTIAVTGALVPTFFDVEIANNRGVDLDLGINVLNNTNFITGDFRTPRNLVDTYYNFLQDAFTVGESDRSKINGYAVITDIQSFSFPVGDELLLRPLILNSDSPNAFARCAYFFEDPNNPSTFPSFNTNLKPREIADISRVEFWRLEGSVPGTVSVSWNDRSRLANIAIETSSIILVGWSKAEQRWLDLGNTALGGDLANGFVTSATFIPDEYEAITFGSTATPTDILTLDNYYVSPNGDGVNDFLEIPELSEYPNNSISIFDRFGLKVFEMKNYRDEFRGFSNVNNLIINKEIGLPAGVYFYLITLDDLDFNYQGFLYLERQD